MPPRRRGLSAVLVVLSVFLLAAAFAANYAVKQQWAAECTAVGQAQEGESTTMNGSSCNVGGRSGAQFTRRSVHLPVIATNNREATVAMVLPLCAFAGAALLTLPCRRSHRAPGRPVWRPY